MEEKVEYFEGINWCTETTIQTVVDEICQKCDAEGKGEIDITKLNALLESYIDNTDALSVLKELIVSMTTNSIISSDMLHLAMGKWSKNLNERQDLNGKIMASPNITLKDTDFENPTNFCNGKAMQLKDLKFKYNNARENLKLARHQHVQLEEEILNLQTQIRCLKNELTCERNKVDQLEKKLQVNEDVTETLNKALKEKRDLQNALSQREEEFKDMQTEIDQLRNENWILEKRTEKTAAEHKDALETLTNLEIMVNRKNAKTESLSSTIRDLHERLNEQNDELTRLSCEKEKLQIQKQTYEKHVLQSISRSPRTALTLAQNSSGSHSNADATSEDCESNMQLQLDLTDDLQFCLQAINIPESSTSLQMEMLQASPNQSNDSVLERFDSQIHLISADINTVKEKLFELDNKVESVVVELGVKPFHIAELNDENICLKNELSALKHRLSKFSMKDNKGETIKTIISAKKPSFGKLELMMEKREKKYEQDVEKKIHTIASLQAKILKLEETIFQLSKSICKLLKKITHLSTFRMTFQWTAGVLVSFLAFILIFNIYDNLTKGYTTYNFGFLINLSKYIFKTVKIPGPK